MGLENKNFWLFGDLSGWDRPLKSGPKGNNGNFNIVVKQLNGSRYIDVVRVVGVYTPYVIGGDSPSMLTTKVYGRTEKNEATLLYEFSAKKGG